MKTKAHTFKTFPEFSELMLADRENWEDIIADYPPISSISFAELMTWWSLLDNCKVAQIDNNFVISYWMPGDEQASGLCVIGTNKVDNAICEVFDHQKKEGQSPKLVHVPEFVVNSMAYPELYKFTPERCYDECVLPVAKYSTLTDMVLTKRRKIRRFLMGKEKTVEFKSLDLSMAENKEYLFSLHKKWEHKGGLNNIGKREKDYMYQLIENAEQLGSENVSLYIDGEIHSFILYQQSDTPGYLITNVARFSYARPFLFEFCVHEYAKWFAKQGIKFINIQEDLDQITLRIIKLSLGPVNFFRKYTIEPREAK